MKIEKDSPMENITVRQFIAALLLAGMVANEMDWDSPVSSAVEFTDKLIQVLNTTQP